MSEAPTVYGKRGEFQMPQDIWETAKQIVEAISSLSYETFDDFNLDEMACTIIASALYAERAGMTSPKN